MDLDRTKTLRLARDHIPFGTVVSEKYRIIREIGRGGMGVVYEAEDTKLKRPVALKFLPADLTIEPEARERFIQEAQAASALDHPNICVIHEIDKTEAGEIYIVMACYKGESLREKIERGPIAAAEVIHIAAQVAEGLAKAHEQDIVHRDIKPANIFITADGTAKIVDFGLAKLAGQIKLTLPGTIIGTAAYMSPEQARGENVDVRTDVWSLGVIIYEMATGGLPFQGDNEQSVLYAILNEPPRPVKTLRPGFPSQIEHLLRTALAKDREKRFASAREMAEGLKDLSDRMKIRAFPAVGRISFRQRRRRWLLVAAGTAAVVLVALGIWLLTKPSLAFESRDQLMVADVDNLADDKVFDLALRTAIEADLQQSPYAAIFDRPQIAETLRLMRMDPASKVDEAIGYEICRFAGVRAFILPRILSVGEAYELQAILIDPAKRRYVDRFRVTARGKEEVLLKGIDKLAEKLRSRLGESLPSIEKAKRPVTEVTTSSWDALNYYSMGMAKRESLYYKEAAALLELALEKDPQFVDARGALGTLQILFLKESVKGKDMLRQALKDAESQNMPQRDILKLKAINKWFVDGDLAGALEDYQMILELFPDFSPAWNNSGRILMFMGRYEEAEAMFEKAAELAPRSIIPLQNMYLLFIFYTKNAKTAERAARRMAILAPKLAYPFICLGYCLAAQGRFEEAEKELRKAVESEPEDPLAVPNLAHLLLAMGRPGEAVPIYRKVLDLTRQGKTEGTIEEDTLSLMLALKYSGDIEEAKRLGMEIRESVNKRAAGAATKMADLFTLGEIAAVLGQTSEAERYLQRILGRAAKDPGTLMEIAEFHALLGQDELAISALKKSLEAGYKDYFFPVILPFFQSIRAHPEFKALYKLPK